MLACMVCKVLVMERPDYLVKNQDMQVALRSVIKELCFASDSLSVKYTSIAFSTVAPSLAEFPSMFYSYSP